jgi:hypothetical protein
MNPLRERSASVAFRVSHSISAAMAIGRVCERTLRVSKISLTTCRSQHARAVNDNQGCFGRTRGEREAG